MALKMVFIPLSMLMRDSLNRIETNQDVKYKHISYGSGSGKIFLDEVCFPSKDDLNDFKFNQAYMNWLMPIEAVCDPAVEQGWHAHHKCMISDMKFLDWVQAWCTHNHMLRTCFMLKPFILDVSS